MCKNYRLSTLGLVMLAVPVIAGVTVFGLLVSWGSIFHDGDSSTIAENRTTATISASETYNNPVPDGNNINNSGGLFYSSDVPSTKYLEERVGGSEYTQLEDNRTFVGN